MSRQRALVAIQDVTTTTIAAVIQTVTDIQYLKQVWKPVAAGVATHMAAQSHTVAHRTEPTLPPAVAQTVPEANQKVTRLTASMVDVAMLVTETTTMTAKV
jgi:hypothetical protein